MIQFKKKKPVKGSLFRPVRLNTKQNISNIKRKDLTWDQATIRYPKIKAFGDRDRDGILNVFDCKPFDSKRHGRPDINFDKDGKIVIPSGPSPRDRPRLKDMSEAEREKAIARIRLAKWIRKQREDEAYTRELKRMETGL